MNDPDGLGNTHSQLSISARIDLACDRFEEAWHQSPPPRLEDYLAHAPKSHREKMFCELLEIELAYRQKDGEALSAEEYQRRFPDFKEQIDALFSKCVTHRRLGDYELLDELGHGGMGVVYKARQVLLNQTVALKVLPQKYLDDRQAVARFRREMQVAGAVEHANIVRAYNAGEEEGLHFLVMEYVDGVNLQELVARQGPVPVAAACEIVRQAAIGLHYAHQHGLVHRDIKPANLMLSRTGTVKILDLGLARFRADQQLTQQLTQSGITMGTLDYMAPEQWDDSHTVGIGADIYSLGCTLFYLLTGMAPYGQEGYDTVRKKLKAHAMAPIPTLSDRVPNCPKKLDKILGKMLAKETEDRYHVPGELVDAIGPLADPAALRDLLPELAEGKPSTHVSAVTGWAASNVETHDQLPPELRADRPTQRQPGMEPWYRHVPSVAGLFLLAAVMVFLVVWLTKSPFTAEQQQQLRAELGALPGLNGEWWFVETPWYTPGIRAEILRAIENGETSIGGVALLPLLESIRGSDVEDVHKDLLTVANALQTRLSGSERELTEKLVAADPQSDSKKSYGNRLATFLRSVPAPEHPTATEQHLRAVMLHYIAVYAEAPDEAKETVIAAYEEARRLYDEQVAPDELKELKARRAADYGALLVKLGRSDDAIPEFRRAAKNVPPSTFRISLLCQEADASRDRGVGYLP